ncbi:DNA adenine methylase [Alicyclobacillus tolerans]|uniref:Site-specific DNA-methyltransferase (adenine-specific) n=2 Tax=Alicyclobacillus tolerans TaxID=90970 RepID=A0A1M6JV15_9BACL|nr:DNA adenine methylase [Alicyclobacillus montanus]
MKPFLKWAGNKHRIMDKIRELLPHGRRLIEPFAGSAAVFLNTDYKENILNDMNSDLIHLFMTLKEYGLSFIDECKQLFIDENNTPQAYYQLREEFNQTTDLIRKAALFLYLNRHGYNGLCRYNSFGHYNVPFGRYKKPYFPYKEMVIFYQKAQTAHFISEDFESVMNQAELGDVIYCDPPYVPISQTANFTSYHANGFGPEEQLRLAKVAEELSKKGIPVLISNHFSDFTLKAYSLAEISIFDVQRFISCDGKKRKKVTELLALFSGKKSI